MKGKGFTRRGVLGCSLVLACAPVATEAPLTVSAAASLTDVCAELGRAFEASDGGRIRFNFAGSNMLARQILAAPSAADVFISADRAWAREVLDQGRTAGELISVLSNGLAVVGWPTPETTLECPQDLAAVAFRHLAMADPDAVPAGRYARAWLEGQGLEDGSLWDALEPRVAPTPDVRAALALVESDPRILGIVYRTDARRADRARILYDVPLDEHPPIDYVAVLTGTGRQGARARAFVEFLRSEQARDIYTRHGFMAAR